MKVRISYKIDLTEAAGAPAAKRWTEEVEIDTDTTIEGLMASAERADATITQILISESAFVPVFATV
jgi:hypothetical protein